ncbi:hypothetical protein V3331_16335 [Gaopeijia maritima]|uniref:hypothetical protein n=1 Tax=Gaopeijia maritima TaxID=3119007 RepID=UPI0032560C38
MKLTEKYVAAESTHAAHLAATVVHEAAHIRLEESGVRYTPDRRRRIEAICVRAEARFAERITGGQELAQYYRASAARILDGPDAAWSNDAFRARDLETLLALETPTWILRLFGATSAEIALARESSHADAHDV